MPSLQELCLHGCVWSTSTGSQNTLRWVVKNLSEIPDSLQLSRVTLLFTIEDFGSLPNSGLERAGWEDLVTVVERLAKCSEVHIHISVLGSFGPYVEDLLNERLSQLRSLKVLTINRVGSEGSIN